MCDEQKLYSLADWERLMTDVGDVVERAIEDACEKTGEEDDAIIARMTWPLRVFVYRRMKLVPEDYVERAVADLLDVLDEEHADPDGDSTSATETMRAAARTFIAAVLAEYVPWTCERTGEVIEVTEAQAREMLGEDKP